MSKSTNKGKTYYAAYIGIVLLYLKLFFIEPIVVVGGIDFTFGIIVLIFLLVRVFFKVTISHINVFGNNSAAKMFWSLIVISTISSFFLSPSISSGVFTANLQLFLIYLLFIDFKSINIYATGLVKIINALTYFALFNAFTVIYSFFFGKISLTGEVFEQGDGITRAFGFMGDQVAWFLTFFAMHSLYKNNKYHFLIFTIAILMGASLGATIVLILIIFIYYIRNKRLAISTYLKIGVSVLLFIFLMISNSSILSNIGLLKRIDSGDFSSTDSQTTGHRYNAIVNALDRISEKPLWGYQNYSLSMFNRYDVLLSEIEKGKLTFLTTPNNQILAIVCDYGFIGLLFFIFFILSLIKIINAKCSSMPTEIQAFKQAASVWIVVFLIFNQSATWFLPSSYLWILICLLVSISYKINQLYGSKK